MHAIAVTLPCFLCFGVARRLNLQLESQPDSRQSQRALNSTVALLLDLRSPAAGWQNAAGSESSLLGHRQGTRTGQRSNVVMKRYKAPPDVERHRRASPNLANKQQRPYRDGGESTLMAKIREIKEGKKKPLYSVGRAASTKRAELDDDYISEEKYRDLFGTDREWEARANVKSRRQYRKIFGRTLTPQLETAPKSLQSLGDTATHEKEDDEQQKWQVQVESNKLASFFATAQNFTALGATEDLQASLEAMGIERPSRVQGAGFDPIVKGEDTILADQTGSGKTVAYLAPIIQVLRAREKAEGLTPKGHVRAVVLAPTSELAAQVLSVAKAIAAGGVPFRSGIVTGGHEWRTQVNTLRKGLELLVCTPGRFRSHIEAGSLDLSQTRHVVLDEADLLFEDEDFPLTWELLRHHVSDDTATAFVTATLPEWLVSLVRKDLPLVKIRKGRNLHRTAAGVTETLIDCSGGQHVSYSGEEGFKAKTDALMRELAKHDAERVLVFCNTIESARKVENFLRRRDRRSQRYEVYAFHGAIATETRKETMARFLSEEYESGAVPRILVCTDRASRGIDFRLVKHVVLYDFPRDGVEYVRRVGRATRGTGDPGHVTSLLLGRQVAYARALMKINREGRKVNLDVHGTNAPTALSSPGRQGQ